jgi:hypothetical protein
VRHAALESRDTAHLFAAANPSCGGEVCATLAAASALRAIRGSRKEISKKSLPFIRESNKTRGAHKKLKKC